MEDVQIKEMMAELEQQTAAVCTDDLSRAESMLMAQAHTLDGLFAKLACKAMTSSDLDRLERYMRLALKAQNQARATLQSLGELKAPKQIAFVQQANIGSQVQVNNDNKVQRPRARKNKKAPNELLEVEYGERLDARAAGAAGGADQEMAAVAKQHRTGQRRR